MHIAQSCLPTAATKIANVRSCPYLGKPGLKVWRYSKKEIVFAAEQTSLSLGRRCHKGVVMKQKSMCLLHSKPLKAWVEAIVRQRAYASYPSYAYA